MSKVVKVFQRRADAFEVLIQHVDDDDWSAPTPCAEWNVRGVVGHVVAKMAEVLETLDVVPASSAPSVDDDPLGAFQAARQGIQAVLDDPVLSKTRTDTAAGELMAIDMIDRVVSQDMVVHAWDLAVSTDQDARMFLPDVRAVFPYATTITPKMRKRGAIVPGMIVYGPEVRVPPGASAQDRLLGMLGRKPHWSAPRRARRR